MDMSGLPLTGHCGKRLAPAKERSTSATRTKRACTRSLVQPAMDDFAALIQSALEQFNQLSGGEQNQSNVFLL